MSEHINNLTTLCYIEKDDQYLICLLYTSDAADE